MAAGGRLCRQWCAAGGCARAVLVWGGAQGYTSSSSYVGASISSSPHTHNRAGHVAVPHLTMLHNICRDTTTVQQVSRDVSLPRLESAATQILAPSAPPACPRHPPSCVHSYALNARRAAFALAQYSQAPVREHMPGASLITPSALRRPSRSRQLLPTPTAQRAPGRAGWNSSKAQNLVSSSSEGAAKGSRPSPPL